jgi:putative membrane protein
MVGLIIRILGNALALYAAFLLVPGFVFHGGMLEYVTAGVLLGLLNMIVKPVLKTISLPLIIITLGLFTLFINALILWVVDYIFDFMTIQNIYALFWSTAIVSVVNVIFSKSTKIIS